MALFNYATREINAKIVYYGIGLGGKTTNIQQIYQRLSAQGKGKLVTIPTYGDRTVFLDFFPVDVGEINGFKLRFHLYTVPGQVFYNTTRKLVLKGADGVVFVADSQREALDSNLQSLKNLRENLMEEGIDLDQFPFVIQYNKRDLSNVFSIEELNGILNRNGVPIFEAAAVKGEGVIETLKAIGKVVVKDLKRSLTKRESAAPKGLAMEMSESPKSVAGETVTPADDLASPGLVAKKGNSHQALPACRTGGPGDAAGQTSGSAGDGPGREGTGSGAGRPPHQNDPGGLPARQVGIGGPKPYEPPVISGQSVRAPDKISVERKGERIVSLSREQGVGGAQRIMIRLGLEIELERQGTEWKVRRVEVQGEDQEELPMRGKDVSSVENRPGGQGYGRVGGEGIITPGVKGS
jgi:signal recognition particle receptor subunit beta